MKEALTKAKDLRNDNNYESLLIAHEYRHIDVTALFERLAVAMKNLAERGLRLSVDYFSHYMESRSDNERTFISVYADHRIVCPIGEWYGEEFRTSIRQLIAPLLTVPHIDAEGAYRIDEKVSREFFNLKDGIMNEVERKILALEREVA